MEPLRRLLANIIRSGRDQIDLVIIYLLAKAPVIFLLAYGVDRLWDRIQLIKLLTLSRRRKETNCLKKWYLES